MIDGPAVSLLTPAGRGAIAVVRVSGVGAVRIADAVFRPHRGVGLAQTPSGQLRLGRVGQGRGDEVVAVLLDEEPEAVELQCHGGSAAVNLVIDALERAGARRSDPAAFLDKPSRDPIVVEATLDLCHAPTLKTAEILLEQAHGALSRDLEGLARSIVQNGPTAPALLCLEALIARSTFGLRLLAGWKVVIAGRPNVGKSRLLNALAGFTRAIVDPTPGTTRDVVTCSAALEGWPIELADTAGLRGTCDAIELEGIARSRREQEEADLVLVVLDRSDALQDVDHKLVVSTANSIVVLNKSDLPAAWRPEELPDGPQPRVTISAERGDGISDLCARIVRTLVPSPPTPDDAVPFRPRHAQALERAHRYLVAGDRSSARTLIESLLKGT
jgi:tRNA modification GTPase